MHLKTRTSPYQRGDTVCKRDRMVYLSNSGSGNCQFYQQVPASSPSAALPRNSLIVQTSPTSLTIPSHPPQSYIQTLSPNLSPVRVGNQTSPRQTALSSSSLPLLPSPPSLPNKLSSPPLSTNLPSPPLDTGDVLLSPFFRQNVESQNFLEHMIRIREQVQKSGHLALAQSRAVVYQPIPRKSL